MQAVISDTVGFIQKLPPKLVAAFQATLDDINSATLILHVVDCSHPLAAAQSDAVVKVQAADAPIDTWSCACRPLPAIRSCPFPGWSFEQVWWLYICDWHACRCLRRLGPNIYQC